MQRRAVNKGGRRRTMSDILRKAISESGLTLYRISKDSGVPYATLHRFVRGQRGVSMEALDKLCFYLGMRLTHQ
jgi:predicted transcriptional regulator